MLRINQFLLRHSVGQIKLLLKPNYYRSLIIQIKQSFTLTKKPPQTQTMIPVATQQETLNFFTQKYSQRKKKIWAFYNSEFNKIVLDQKYMLLPADDRLATRGHGTFDVVYVKNKNIINLDAHIDRLYASSQTVEITPPIEKEKARQIIIEVMKAVFRRFLELNPNQGEEKLSDQIFGIRMVMSSGYGDFGISSIDKKAVFYVFVFQPYINRSVEEQGVKDYVVKFVKDIKNELVHTKTTNYLENAMMANASKVKGGYVGIKALESGVLLQASIANVAFIFGKEFATPRFQTVIKGTTIIKLLKYIEELKEERLIEKISFRDIKIEEAQHADEMIIIGGDKIVPVLQFNDKVISEKRGPFTEMFQKWYKSTNQQLTKVQI